MRLLSSTSLTLCWKTFRRDGAGAGTSWGLKIIFISELWNWTSYKWFLLSTYIKLHIIRWPPAIKRGLLENPPFVISWFSQLESFISMADFQASHVWLPARISNYFHTSYPIIYYPTVLLSHITLFLSHDCLLISHHPYQTTSIYIYIYILLSYRASSYICATLPFVKSHRNRPCWPCWPRHGGDLGTKRLPRDAIEGLVAQICPKRRDFHIGLLEALVIIWL